MVLVLLAGLIAVAIPQPAHGCSCAGPGDLSDAIDNSEAAFVGTLVGKRDVGGGEAIYTFEVEEWVKGDLGAVIEVRSASQGSACGFETHGERVGAFLRMERGHLTGGLCSQVAADSLLAAAHGPNLSTTGTGTVDTVPPLVAPDLGVDPDPGAGLRWLGGLALVSLLAGLFVLARRSPS